MAKELSEITNKDIEESLTTLLKGTLSAVSKFSVRRRFIDLLIKNEVELSKEDQISLLVGDDSDDYSKKINKTMLDKGYILSTHSYSRHLY
jgi:hypothetical protein